LFHKAIGESGGAMGRGMPGHDSLAEREKRDEEWVATLGVTTLAQLRALPAETILEASRKKSHGGFGPDVDGKLLTEPVADTYAEGKQAHVSLLAGWNRDEGNSEGMTMEKWNNFALDQFKDRAEEFLKLYPGDTDEQAARSAADFNGDMFIAFGTWRWIEAHRKTGDSPIYRYHFELAAPPSKFNPVSAAFHSDDIAYVFGTLDTRSGAVWRPEDRKLSDQMMDYWTNFAKTGDPNGPRLPEWPKYGKDDELIHLDSTITSGPDTLRPRYEFLEEMIPVFNSQARAK
jgi:para-nitrobenzyl esterase